MAPTSPTCASAIELTDLTEYFGRDAVPGVPEPVRRRGGHAGRCEPGPAAARRLAGMGEAARRPRARLRAGRRGRLARRPGRQEPLRGRARRAWPKLSARSPATASSSARARRTRPARCSARPGGDRPAAGVLDESAWSFVWIVDAPMFEAPPRRPTSPSGTAVDGAAPRLHLAERRLDRQVRRRPRQRAGLRLRHRLQRQRDRRRLDPYPPRRRAAARLRGDGPRRGRGAGEVRFPARRVRLRAAAARRHRVRLGPDLRAAFRRGLDPRGDRVPEDRRWLRPVDRRARADHGRAAQGSGRRRRTGHQARFVAACSASPADPPGRDGGSAGLRPG